MLKILILLFYYNRPQMVKDALQSIKESTYTNWELCFIDDASDFPGEPIAREILSEEELAKTTFINISDSKIGKLERKGSWIGKVANEHILTSGSDLCIFLSDDDMLFPTYMADLDRYYSNSRQVQYSYCHVQNFGEAIGPSWLNHTETLDPFCRVDASQVTWRTSCWTEGGVRFPFPKTSCLDSDIFGQLCEKYGLCPFNGMIGQLKRIHPGQLGKTESLDWVDTEHKPYEVEE